ncbi:hypothetical protein RND71_024902 [Anisodus tanguticus]|uniref:Uncharacterized protein n=1 Tax=Anisodus tanguticus TaxID=243964 RepID=A0AAE1V9X4_9SOLA|nr:hypothetical protein RND71_024902 [Anisodus tanguticus]
MKLSTICPFECTVMKGLWHRILLWQGFHKNIGDWEAEVQWVTEWARKKTGQGAIRCSFAMLIYVMWRERNQIRFKQSRYQADRVCKELALHIHIRGGNLKQWQPWLAKLNSIQ